MKIKKLFKDLAIKEIKGSKELEISGICSNSNYAFPGCLYIAKKGITHDGSQFIPQAVAAGALAVVCDIYDPFLENIVQVICENPSEIEGEIARRYFEDPSKEIFTVGITGTNGKTTTSYLIKHIFDQLDNQCGLIGTIETIVGKMKMFSSHTTPDSISNQKLLREMLRENCKAAVMEVSSHGLVQNRVKNISYDVAVFTNFTAEHLDYHENMQNYLDAKMMLFRDLEPSSAAILNIDCPVFEKLKKITKAKIFTYGVNNKADVMAENIAFSSSGSTFDLCYQDQKVKVHLSLLGDFNIYNALAAAAVALVKGCPLEKIQRALSSHISIPGRLEKLHVKTPFDVYIDYAHTEDALEKTLQNLQKIQKNKIICVFGCGGDRDKQKRPRMAKVCEKYSDFCVITADNPRSEDPELICQEICEGFEKTSHVVEIDRYLAIKKAVSVAQEKDIILIAGKGHETKQIFSHQTIDFDDKKIAKEICSQIFKNSYNEMQARRG